MGDQVEMSGDELFRLFIHPMTAKGKVAALPLDEATKMIEYRRQKLRKETAVAALTAPSSQIAQAILAYACALQAKTTSEACALGNACRAAKPNQIPAADKYDSSDLGGATHFGHSSWMLGSFAWRQPILIDSLPTAPPSVAILKMADSAENAIHPLGLHAARDWCKQAGPS